MSELQSADAMPVLCYANGFLSFFLTLRREARGCIEVGDGSGDDDGGGFAGREQV